jgi:hypothetical protein
VTDGWLLVVAGVLLLATAGAYLAVATDVEPRLFRFNFPRLSERFPHLPDRAGGALAWSTAIFGTLLGVAAIVYGLIDLLRA